MRAIDANELLYKLANTDPNTKGRFADGIVKAMAFIVSAPAAVCPDCGVKMDGNELNKE